MSRGVCYIAFGGPSQLAARLSLESLRRHHRSLPAVVLGDDVPGAMCLSLKESSLYGLDNVQRSRWAKTRLDQLSPFDETLYLDADTHVHGDLTALFDVLSDGWELVITASDNQNEELLWHVGQEERECTLEALGNGRPLQLQGGVLAFKKGARTAALFHAWRDEWSRWQGQDQGALLRALNREPLRVWLMGRCFNSGAVVAHRFGMARR